MSGKVKAGSMGEERMPGKLKAESTGEEIMPGKLKAGSTGEERMPGKLKAGSTGEERMPGKLKAASTGEERMPGKLKAASTGEERSNVDRHLVWQISLFVGLSVCIIAVMYMKGPGKEFNDVTLKGVREISFEDLDRNNDGCITKSEFVQLNQKVEGVGRSSDAHEVPRPDEPNANNVTTLEAEDGEKYEVFQIDEIVYSLNMVKLQPEKRLQWMKQLPYKDVDIIVCSYAKTGTHWMTNNLHFLLYDGDLSELSSISPYLLDIPLSDSSALNSEKRILASHLQPHRLPDEHLAKGGKLILMFRNPKDTLVSHFHQFRKHKLLSKTKLSWDRFLSYWQDGKIPVGSYFDFYNSWQTEMERNEKMNVLVVHYEDLQKVREMKDILHELRRIESYLGLQLSDERLRQVIDKSMFENLKADVDSGKVETILRDENGKSFLYRKGIVGDWKNHFTIAQNEKFETAVNEKFKDSIFKYRQWD